MQLQETDWQTEVASNRIGPPSSWTPVAAQFGAQPAVTGMLYYSETGCFLIPDEATPTHPAGMQSLMWGPGLTPAITDQAGEHALVELAGSQISMAADHAEALVGLAQDASGPSPEDSMPIPAQPQAAQSFDAQSAADPRQQYPAAPYGAAGQAYDQPDTSQYPAAQPYGAPAEPSPEPVATQPDPGYQFPAATPDGGPAPANQYGSIPPPPAGYVQMPETGPQPPQAQHPQQPQHPHQPQPMEAAPTAGATPEANDGSSSSLLKILIWVAVGFAVIAIGYLLYSTVLSGSGSATDLDSSVTLASGLTHTLVS